MKRILYLLASVACTLAGCTVEPAESPLSGSDAPVFKAYYSEDGQTRTTLDETQLGVRWSAGDAISVFDKDNTNHKYVASAAGKQCDFTLDGGSSVSTPGTWYAIYPYDAKTIFDGLSFKLTLPDSYTLTKPGTFADGMNVAVASSTTLDLPFRNVLGWIAFAIKGADHVSRVRFTGNADEAVSGVFSVDAKDLAVKAVAPGEKVMVLNIENFQESASRENAAWYYIPVVPGTFGKGFSIIVSKRDGDYTFKYDKSATFQRGQKRELFIEIPGADDKYIDLVSEPLQWTTNLEAADPVCWDASHRIYPSTHADLAWAEWTWNNGPETYEYPEGFPQLDVYKKRVRVYKCLFDNDALLFNVPVKEIPAGKTLTLDFCLRGGKWMPAAWTVEACLDGSNWVTMDVTGEKEGSTGINYKDRNGDDRTAPLYMTKEDQEHYFRATTTLSAPVSKQTVQLRIRVLIARGITGSLASTPSVNNNSNCHFSLTYYTLDGVKYFGPRLSVR